MATYECSKCGMSVNASCGKCNKGFLPLNYFSKVHAKNSEEYKQLFARADELHPDDLVKGLYVLW